MSAAFIGQEASEPPSVPLRLDDRCAPMEVRDLPVSASLFLHKEGHGSLESDLVISIPESGRVGTGCQHQTVDIRDAHRLQLDHISVPLSEQALGMRLNGVPPLVDISIRDQRDLRLGAEHIYHGLCIGPVGGVHELAKEGGSLVAKVVFGRILGVAGPAEAVRSEHDYRQRYVEHSSHLSIPS